MENYELLLIRNFFDALKIRNIRNQVRDFMTNNNSEISFLQQLIWYYRIYQQENAKGNLYCYKFKSNKSILGFGLIRLSKGKYWITGALTFDQRGKGIGIKLFKELVDFTPNNFVWLEVLESNVPARKIYKKLGFVKIKEASINRQKVIIMRLDKNIIKY